MFPISSNSDSDSDSILYVDDVFSTWLYTGNGATQTITNGIDLAGKGGLVWFKNRNTDVGLSAIHDTVRGSYKRLSTNLTTAEYDYGSGSGIGVTSFNNNGFNLGTGTAYNGSTDTYASWTFRKAAKFFDVVTYTGDGVAGRQIAHSLGVAPGMIIVKRANDTSNWVVGHTYDFSNALNLNNTGAATTQSIFNGTNASVFSQNNTSSASANGYDINQSGGTYVAYLFAHDTSSTGIIQCGSYVGNGSITGPVVTLGWEPQYVMVKNATTSGFSWGLFDSMRGMPVGSNDSILYANIASAEVNNQGACLAPNATGFSLESASSICNSSGDTYIYMAIRMPNKPPTSGTQVYNAIARTGTGAAATVSGVGFPTDLVFHRARLTNVMTPANMWQDRLRGIQQYLKSNNTNQEFPDTAGILTLTMDGMTVGIDSSEGNVNASTATYINYFFKRAPGFFDVVCSTFVTGTNRYIHNLTVAPELILLKSRSNTSPWYVYISPALGGGYTNHLTLNTTNAIVPLGTSNYWGGSNATATDFGIANGGFLGNGWTFTAYLFATLGVILGVIEQVY